MDFVSPTEYPQTDFVSDKDEIRIESFREYELEESFCEKDDADEFDDDDDDDDDEPYAPTNQVSTVKENSQFTREYKFRAPSQDFDQVNSKKIEFNAGQNEELQKDPELLTPQPNSGIFEEVNMIPQNFSQKEHYQCVETFSNLSELGCESTSVTNFNPPLSHNNASNPKKRTKCSKKVFTNLENPLEQDLYNCDYFNKEQSNKRQAKQKQEESTSNAQKGKAKPKYLLKLRD